MFEQTEAIHASLRFDVNLQIVDQLVGCANQWNRGVEELPTLVRELMKTLAATPNTLIPERKTDLVCGVVDYICLRTLEDQMRQEMNRVVEEMIHVLYKLSQRPFQFQQPCEPLTVVLPEKKDPEVQAICHKIKFNVDVKIVSSVYSEVNQWAPTLFNIPRILREAMSVMSQVGCGLANEHKSEVVLAILTHMVLEKVCSDAMVQTLVAMCSRLCHEYYQVSKKPPMFTPSCAVGSAATDVVLTATLNGTAPCCTIM